jgi:hypothetical protein
VAMRSGSSAAGGRREPGLQLKIYAGPSGLPAEPTDRPGHPAPAPAGDPQALFSGQAAQPTCQEPSGETITRADAFAPGSAGSAAHRWMF